ncbi:hypothetical protein [Chamaesiphon minutus]|uniref:Uncharacterized protein n=1 Tax=Chamaesiphon minutus (strain ATCC 27169 / PCC 6605) TaxID=1173020 RepID=K9UIQ9_CHAP6|nr:hypothetical protein [Chamaesiphon minutus]AFY94997.1 hypothetical protein Cha6605_4041 [Chamaesiphon minutus PCC 6605]
MSSAQFPTDRPPSHPEAATRPAKPIKRPKKPDPADYPPLPPMLQLTGNTPIPPASEPLQYRAIGLILGKYIPSSEEFNQGMVLADDGTEIDAVILGRIMSLIKNHLDLEKSHLWVVYPRIRKEDNKLHAQIMGMWDPQLVIKPLDPTIVAPEGSSEPVEVPPMPTIETLGIPDSYFSIRGEVIYQSRESKEIFVKIRQAPKKKTEEERYFKIRLIGDLPQKLVGNFWDFDVVRVENNLQIRSGQFVATLRAKTPRKGGGKPPIDGAGSKPFKKPWDGDDAKAVTPRSEVEKPKPAPIKRSLPQKLELPDRS